MAVTWPLKNNFADGNVLTAAQMNNIGDTVNVFNPSAATNGQVWVANGSGSGAYATPSGGFTLIQSITMTSGTRHTISGIPGSYEQLFFRILNCTVSGGPAGLAIEINGNTSNYRMADRFIFGTSIGTNNYSTSANINASTSQIWASRVMTVEAAVRNQFYGTIPGYASTSTNYKTVQVVSSGLQASGVHSVSEVIGYHDGTTGAITSVAVFGSGATFTGGTFQLYGVR
jgi:hypothetical protein